jgi:hypothetical protein
MIHLYVDKRNGKVLEILFLCEIEKLESLLFFQFSRQRSDFLQTNNRSVEHLRLIRQTCDENPFFP